MAKHRSHSIAFKRQVAQEYIAGETLHGLAKRHDLSGSDTTFAFPSGKAGWSRSAHQFRGGRRPGVLQEPRSGDWEPGPRQRDGR
jgi:hypothetical protein